MKIRSPAMIVQGIEARDANGYVHQSFAPWTAESIGDDHSADHAQLYGLDLAGYRNRVRR